MSARFLGIASAVAVVAFAAVAGVTVGPPTRLRRASSKAAAASLDALLRLDAHPTCPDGTARSFDVTASLDVLGAA